MHPTRHIFRFRPVDLTDIRWCLCLLGLLGFWAMGQVAFAQKGVPFLSNYSVDDYQAAPTNYAAVQDARGVMFVGNRDGVLEYDGISWRLHKLPGDKPALALAVDTLGCLLVGSANEFGCLAPDSLGNLRYKSLSRQLRDTAAIGTIRHIYVRTGGTFFISDTAIFRYFNGQVGPVPVQGTGYSVRYAEFMAQRGKGLIFFDGKVCKRLTGQEGLNGSPIIGPVNYRNQFVIFATAQALYTWRAGKMARYKTGADEYIASNLVSALALLPDGSVAVATERGGLVQLDLSGQISNVLNRVVGLRNEILHGLHLDRQGALWLCLEDGIARAEVSAPLTAFNESAGLKGSVNSILYMNETLYVGTDRGLYILDTQKPRALFEPVRGIISSTLSLVEWNKKLYAATTGGVYEVVKDSSVLLDYRPSTALTLPTGFNPKYVMVGHPDGMSIMEMAPGRKKGEFKAKLRAVKGVELGVKRLEQDKWGRWWGSNDAQLFRVYFKQGIDSMPEVRVFSPAYGLPTTANIGLHKIYNLLRFSTPKGIYQFDYTTGRFVVDSMLRPTWLGKPIDFLYQDPLNRLLLTSQNKLYLGTYNKKADIFEWDDLPFLRLTQAPTRVIYNPVKQNVWIGRDDGIYRFETNASVELRQPFQTLIREVRLGKDSVVFGGNWLAFAFNQDTSQAESLPSFLEGFGALFIRFAAPTFDGERQTQYRYRLVSDDPEWVSSWTPWGRITQADYRNLPPGNYTFEAQARNIYGIVGQTAYYRFVVLLPWYKKPLALWIFGILTLVLFGGIVYVAVKVYSRQLEARNRRLEELVNERTKEIQLKNAALEEKNQQILHQKEEIEEKNKEITDSIVYAERIQKAILPQTERIKQVLDDRYLVLYKPRDIISGDFYWFTTRNGLTFFAAGDCTGHGVPGALMSMIGTSLLNQIVKENGLTEPHEILSALHHGIHTALRQNAESQVRDGMDIAITVIDFEARRLQFASAMRPYFRFHNGQLEEIKGDKHSIGGPEPFREFTKHEMHLAPGDTIYMFSDGFPDQFGGPDEKKYSTRRFKQLLTNIQSKPMQDQLEILDNEFETWKGSYEQIDDVMVVGIRF